MYIVLKGLAIKPETIATFRDASRETARASLIKPGVEQFEVRQDENDPTHFVLLEVYEDWNVRAELCDTPQYQKWQKLLEECSS
jgi:quinol monooxygenase YgiN